MNQYVKALNYNLRNLLSLLSHSHKYSFQSRLHFLHINEQWFRASGKWEENNVFFSNTHANNSYGSLYSILCWLIPMASKRDWQLWVRQLSNAYHQWHKVRENMILSYICSIVQCDLSFYTLKCSNAYLKIQDFFKQINWSKILEEFFFQKGYQSAM